ncbi:hypothetical protein [Sphingomonas sp. LHG3406-1]|uniref:hypothetical protein n=1 Tax=Sphingomonas sp. LHG3406-1 TaxID=2804617 RepID=UPI0026176EBC|nr:hypothetical protein [Sphingomonas sp. LHG3406-1]
MQPDANKPLYAGGLLILVGFLAGSIIGIRQGEPSRGAIIGVGIAVLIAILLWLVGRNRAH